MTISATAQPDIETFLQNVTENIRVSDAAKQLGVRTQDLSKQLENTGVKLLTIVATQGRNKGRKEKWIDTSALVRISAHEHEGENGRYPSVEQRVVKAEKQLQKTITPVTASNPEEHIITEFGFDLTAAIKDCITDQMRKRFDIESFKKNLASEFWAYRSEYYSDKIEGHQNDETVFKRSIKPAYLKTLESK